jgi:hypothetical protein
VGRQIGGEIACAAVQEMQRGTHDAFTRMTQQLAIQEA